MSNEPIQHERFLREEEVTKRFLEIPNEDSFADLFKTFTPQLVAFFRARSSDLALAEDLAQEVMFTVYRKASQIRDRTLFRAWLFKIARNALSRHYGKQSREVDTVDLADVGDRSVAASQKPAATPAFEFMHWMAFLDSREREVMKLRFIEQWEYHEIAATHAIPIGTVQWRVFNAREKLFPGPTGSGKTRMVEDTAESLLKNFRIEVPPLRERKDNILILVEYFVQRYANRAGKNIRSIDKKTLDLLQSYHWPGNIRELQNVIERSMILSSGDVLSVDELWLSKETSPPASRGKALPSFQGEAERRSEREIIEAALAETRGRVSGPSGAAVKLGMSPSTLEDRIKALKIDKRRFKYG